MDFRSALYVRAAAARDDDDLLRIGQRLRDAGLEVASTSADEVFARLHDLTQAGVEPAVILLGPDLPNTLTVARQIHSIWPFGQLLFVPGSANVDALRRELRHAPMIGPNWSLLDIDDPDLAQRVQRAAQASKKRLRLRTTLDRANIQLNTPKPVDHLDYRRLVVSEHYLASLLEQSQDAIIALDAANTVLYRNSGASRMFGGADSSAGTPAARLPFWSAQLDEGVGKIRAGTGRVVLETTCTLPGGETDIEVILSRVHDVAGRFIGTSISLRDISARNQLLETERKARREAERMSRMKDEFLAILSHELRTPLSSVIGRTQLLQMRYQNDPELMSALAVIERNAQLQAKLIADLLDISYVITGKLHLDTKEVSLPSLIEAAIQSIRPTATEKQLEIGVALGSGNDVIEADPHRLEQVLTNLLTNAAKFTPAGGRIDVSMTRSADRVEITVADNGIGIAPDFLPSVFERFGQEDASTTRRHGGLGLGLSIAKQLVELHGGRITAESAGRNRGASFTVVLPAPDRRTRPGRDARRAGSDTSQGGLLSGQRILVVEDIADTRHLVTEALQHFGAEVAAVESGPAALRALESNRPTLLVCDIGMPGMDGYELLRTIRAQGISEDHLPALALTAFARGSDREQALRAGFQAHLAKPIVIGELIATIAKLASARR